ncbi:MAG TPA: aminodeoxychorismate synthase component I [Pyrinomonadaceae bacterium]|nr:aminodeoxychorismate synthase component I [Pyrinomonadaceae bacterium]
MRELQISADQLVGSLLNLPGELNLCLLDSCGVSYLNSHLLVAGICPTEIIEIKNDEAEKTLEILDEKLSHSELNAIFTISYDFGLKLNRIKSRHHNLTEPDVFLALFDVLIIHDYNTHKTYLTGNENKFDKIEKLLLSATSRNFPQLSENSSVSSNFTQIGYIEAVEKIQEFIRCGDTYQTNLTQQIRAELPENLTPERIFHTLRKSHPAPFASFIRRKNDVVISASPERFFRVENDSISTSPIKGTRPRGKTIEEDLQLRNELLNSEKDRAENVMIVDLLRNDIGKICEYGTVKVEKLCDLEEHSTLFHLVSTVAGELRPNLKFSEILRATFPCGSITGAPKIRTMKIIDELETTSRGLSMGAIGFATSKKVKNLTPKTHHSSLFTHHSYDLSVAIRTMTIRGREAVFNVGGGIVIDSDPNSEYEETLTKAKALLNSINGNFAQ